MARYRDNPPTNSSPEPDLRGRFEEDDRLAVDKEESLSQPMTFKTSSQSRSNSSAVSSSLAERGAMLVPGQSAASPQQCLRQLELTNATNALSWVFVAPPTQLDVTNAERDGL